MKSIKYYFIYFKARFLLKIIKNSDFEDRVKVIANMENNIPFKVYYDPFADKLLERFFDNIFK